MAAKKRRTAKRRPKKRRGAGTRLGWKPKTFADALEVVEGAQGVLVDSMARIIMQMGPLPCPAPTWDAQGTYGVGLNGKGGLEVQRLNAGTWEPVSTTPPAT